MPLKNNMCIPIVAGCVLCIWCSDTFVIRFSFCNNICSVVFVTPSLLYVDRLHASQLSGLFILNASIVCVTCFSYFLYYAQQFLQHQQFKNTTSNYQCTCCIHCFMLFSAQLMLLHHNIFILLFRGKSQLISVFCIYLYYPCSGRPRVPF